MNALSISGYYIRVFSRTEKKLDVLPEMGLQKLNQTICEESPATGHYFTLL